MQPKSFSATALQTAGLCLARYKAEAIDRGRGIENVAASLGTSCHDALEMYVVSCYINKTQEPTLELLVDLYKMSFMKTFATSDLDDPKFKEGLGMVKAWWKRTDFSDFTVISAEVKENFPVPVLIGGAKHRIPFNYIWDRHDRLNDGDIRVVDYKTNQASLNTDQLRDKVQARCYSLACRIKYPDAERIWIEFDMLRHDGPVGVVFSRTDDAKTWRWIKSEAQRIIDTPDDRVPERLNGECLFCVRKSSCTLLKKNIDAGGVFGHGTATEMVDLRASLEYQKKAAEAAIKELDEIILGESRATDVMDFESDMHVLSVGTSARRGVDPDRVAMVIGEELFKAYGSSSITLGSVDKLLKSDEIDEDQKKALGSLISKKYGEPKVSVKSKPTI